MHGDIGAVLFESHFQFFDEQTLAPMVAKLRS